MKNIFKSIFNSRLAGHIEMPTEHKPLLRALEPRVLLDAAAAETSFDLAEKAVLESQAEEYVSSGNDDHDVLDVASEALDSDAIAPPLERGNENRRHEVVFIDSAVDDLGYLLDNIRPDVDVVILDDSSDGLEQIAAALDGVNDIDAIHILSHGDVGTLNLGSSTLSSDSMLGEHADELEAVRAALTQGGDILIYGCDFGQGSEGRAAAEQLSELTGADIAASDDLTGAESLNGDWDLEIQAGDVETDALEFDDYNETLAISNNAPTQITFAEDQSYTFSGANAPTVANTTGGDVAVELSVPVGDLTLAQTSGLVFTTGDGSNDSTIVFIGSVADVNAALDGLVYTPTADIHAAAGDISIDFKTTAIDNLTPGGDFEDANIATGTWGAVDQSQVPGWSTSAATGKIEIWDHLSVTDPFDGDQMAELNYQTPDTLSHEVTAVNDNDLIFSFAHQGRDGVETLEVRVTDLGADGVKGGGDDTVLMQKQYSTGQAWEQYTESISGVTAGNKVLLEIESLHAGGSGNLLDAIKFYQEPDPATAVSADRSIDVVITSEVDIVNDSVVVNENGLLTFNPLEDNGGTGADNFENSNAAITTVGTPANGTASIGADGRVTYTPNADFVGTDSFTYTVTSGDTTETATIEVTVEPKPTIGEDSTFTFASSNFTQDADYTGVKITELTLPAGATLQLNGVDVVVGQGISQADIEAGNLVFTPAPDQIGENYFDLKYDVQTTVNLAEGHTSNYNINDSDATNQTLSQTNIRIRSDANFGADGVVEHNFNIINESGTINEAYLADVDVLFDGYVSQGSYSAAEQTAIQDWVENGGVLISTNDTSNYDAISASYGLPIAGNASNTWTIAPPPVPASAEYDAIINGSFGAVGTSITGTTGDYFNASDLQPGDIPLAYSNGDTSKVTMVLRSVGSGFVLFTGDEGVFRAGGSSNVADDFTGTGQNNERFIGNVFEWAANKTADDVTSGAFCLDVTPVADIVNDSIVVNENGLLTFNPLEDNGGTGADNFENSNAAITAVGTPANGTASIGADGRVTYTPNADFVGTDSFTYTVTSGDTTETATIEVTVEPKPTIGEDSTFTFASSNFTQDADYTGVKITELTLPAGATLQLNGVDVVVGQGISQADIEAGNLVFTPAPDQIGENYFDLKYDVQTSVTLAEGHSSNYNIDDSDATNQTLSQTNIRIRSDANFGADGVVEHDFTFKNEQTTINEAYLADVDVLFDGYVSQGSYSAAEQTAIQDWVENGGVLISTNDTSNYDAISASYGLPIAGNASNTWTIAPPPVPASAEYDAIINGSFGAVGTSITGTTGDYFNASDLQPGDIPLAYSNGDTSKVTMVLRSVGSGFVLFTGDEGVFRAGGSSNVADDFTGTGQNNERFIGNVFEWAANKTADDVTSGAFCLDVTSVVDIVDNAVTMQEDASLTLNPLDNDSFENENAEVTAVSLPTHGTAVVNADGTVTYTPNAGYSGTDSFTYTVESGDTTETATIEVTIEPNLETTEDTPLTLNSTSFTAETDYNGIKINGLDQLAGGTLTLDGVAVVEGQVISKADIDAGNLVFTPGSDENGENQLCIEYSVQKTAVALAGKPAGYGFTLADNADSNGPRLSDVNRRLLDSDIFGPDGVSNHTYEIEDPQSAITAAYLDKGNVFFDGWIGDNAYSAAEKTLINDWVSEGNILISTNNDNTHDVLASDAGLAVASSTVDVFDITAEGETHPIFDGPFGPVGSTLDGANINYFTGTILPDDVVLATVSVGGVDQPAMVLRPQGDGFILFMSDVSQFEQAENDPDVTNTSATHKFIGNLFDWAADQTNPDVIETLKVDVIAAVDIDGDTATTSEDNAVVIDVTDNDNFEETTPNVTEVSDPANGSVAINSDGTVTYTPDANFNGTDTFTYTVESSGGAQETATVTVTVTPVNDAPTVTDDSPSHTMAEDGGTASGAIAASDVDGDSLTYTVTAAAAHGSVVVATDGSYVYQPTKDYYGNDTFTIQVSDGNGGTKDVTVSVAITPVDDTAIDSVSVDEDASVTLDPLGNDSFENTGAAVTSFTSGTDGTVTQLADGTLKYTPNAGYSGSDSFTYTVTSGGVTETETVNVTVNPINDAAIIAGTQTGAVTEDGATTSTGTLTISDADGSSEEVFVAQSAEAGTYGEFELSAAGVWSYALNNSAANVQALEAGQTVTDTFTVVSADGTTATVTITITGANDLPTISVVTGDGDGATASRAENGTLTATDTLTVSDADTNDVVTASVKSVSAGTGDTGSLTPAQLQAMLTITPANILDGTETSDQITWTFDAGSEAFDHLAAGEVLTLTYTIEVEDDGGAKATQDIIITITGVNDEPTIDASVDTTITTTEDVAVTGSVTASDKDSDTLTYAVETNGAHGTVTITDAATGAYEYTPKADYNGSDSFVIQVSDGKGGMTNVTINVTVAADADGVADTVAVAEDVAKTFNVLSNDTFEDTTKTIDSFTTPSHGTLTQGSNGEFTYTPTANYNGTDSFTYTVKTLDGVTETITVNIDVTAANDVAIIGGDKTGSVTEDGTQTSNGDLSITDIDGADQQVFAAHNETGTYGTFEMDTDGVWEYTINNASDAVQALEAGQVETDVFTVISADGTESTVTITVNGTNDAPTISAKAGDGDTGSVTDNGDTTGTGNVTVSETLTVTDVDLLDNVSANITTLAIVGDKGGLTSSDLSDMFSISTSGVLDDTADEAQLTWNFEAGTETFDYLAKDETLTLTFTIEVTDDSGVKATKDVVVTITGTNNTPTIDAGVATSITTTEDTAISGTVTASDVDSDTLTYSVDTDASKGSVVITDAATGAYTYTPNPDYNGPDSFVIQVSDGTTTEDVTINVSVSADADIGTDSVTTNEDTDVIIDVSGNDSFEDTDSTTSVVAGSGPSNGSVVLNSDGTFTYTPNLNYNGSDSFTYKVTSSDGIEETATVNITIVAQNDAAIITGDKTGEVTEDLLVAGVAQATGDLDVTDNDSAAVFEAQTDTAGEYGSFSIGADGEWTYTLDNAKAQELEAGEAAHEIFTVETPDDTQTTVTITVTGVNDEPTITVDTGAGDSASATVTEDGSLLAEDTLTIADDDLLDVVTASVKGLTISGTQGTLTETQLIDMFSVVASGSTNGTVLDGTETSDQLTWKFNPGSEGFEYLAGDQSLTLTYQIEVKDDFGATVTKDIIVTINGVNDDPVISSSVVTDISTTEDTDGSGSISATDIDSDPLTYSVDTQALHGTVSILSDGSYTYEPKDDYNGSDTFTLKVSDDQGGSSTVTIDVTVAADKDGVNDAVEVTEDIAKTFDVTSNETFEDANAVVAKATDPTHGTLTDNGDGTFTYEPHLNYHGADSFTYTVTTVDNVTETVTVNITVTAENDIAIITGTKTGDVTEDTQLSAGGDLIIQDVDDVSQQKFTPVTDEAGTYGTFSMDEDGTWSYALDTTKDDVLEAGETVDEVFTVTSVDGTEATVTITVTGANDDPVISIETGDKATAALTENGTITATDTLTVTDVDLLDNVSATVTTVDIDGDQGSLTDLALSGMFSIAASDVLDGTETTDQITWEFDAGSEAFDHLAAGEVLTLTYTIEVEDDENVKDTQTVVVKITGVNDAPTIDATVQTAITTSEDTDAIGTVTATDKDSDTLVYTVETQPAHGTVVITDAATGAYKYTPHADYNGSDPFTIKVADTTDDTGGSDTITITMTVDAVADGVIDDVTTAEDTPKTFDVFANDTFEDTTKTISSYTEPTHGDLVHGTDGSFTYTPDSNYHGADSFTYTVETLDGITETVTVNLTVTPVNDAANIGGDISGGVTEDSTTDTVTGTLTVTDIDDTADQNFVAQTDEAGDYGSFTLDTNGEWSYELDNSLATVQVLEDGETITDSFVVTSDDGTTATVTVTITGSNDAPTITVETGDGVTAALTEDATLTASDTLTINDVDELDTVEVKVNAVTASGDKGTISDAALKAMFTTTPAIVVDGTETSDTVTWTFNAGSESFDHLAKDEILTLTYEIEAKDDFGASVTKNVVITIKGTNDAPTIDASVDSTIETVEDSTVAGSISASDLDSDTLSYSVGTDGAHGTVVITDAATGEYEYTPDPDYNGSDSFTISVSDGKGGTADVQITVDVSADADISNDSFSTNEDTTNTFDVLANDTFEATNSTVAITVDPTHGDLVDKGNGKFEYTPDPNYHGSDSFTYTVTSPDGMVETATASINVVSITDAAVITGTQTGDVSEDGTTTISGDLNVTDNDGDAEESFAEQTDKAGAYGEFSIDDQGNWDYTLNNSAENVQALEEGQTVTDTFVVESADGTSANVTITITGDNDGPTISLEGGNADTADVSEGATLVAEETITINDLDLTDTVSASVSAFNASGDQGGITNAALEDMFTIDPDAPSKILDGTETTDTLTWKFDPGSATFDYLAKDEVLTLTYTIEVTDEQGATATQDIVIKIKGSNDAPEISTSVDTAISTNEDVAVTGSVSATDTDGDTLSYSVETQAAHGVVSIDSTTGGYTYTPKDDYNGSDVFVIEVSDGNGGTDTVTINVNVSAVVDGAADTVVLAEDTPTSFDVFANDDFEDTTKTISSFTEPAHGDLVHGADGNFTYTPDSNYNGSDSFTYTVETLDGVTETMTVNLTITAVNDGATITGDTVATTSEDGTLTANGELSVSDVDAGDSSFQAQTGSTGTYGSFTLDTQGNWNYVLDNNAANVQALKAGEQVDDVFTVKSADGTEATVTVKVTGANDAPTITVGTGDGATASLTENGTLSATDTLTVSDIDVKDVVSAIVDGLATSGDTGDITPAVLEGMFDIDVNAILSASETSDTLNWTFDADGEAFEYLAKGEVLTLTYTVKVTDGSGISATQDVVITITGINDEPTISTSVDQTPSINEDTTLSGTITGEDVDSDTLSYSVKTDALKGAVQIDSVTGAYTYVPNDDYNGTDSFVITVDDGQGGTKDVTITVTVSSVVDIAADTVSTNEDTPLDIDVLGNDSFEDSNATVVITDGPSNGTLTLNPDGTYKYTPNENYNGADSFTYEVTNSDGITESATVAITVNSVADVADIGGAQTGVASEDGTLTATGNLTITDGDAGEATFQAQTGTAGDYGSLTLTTSGTWTYTLDNNAANVQALKAGQEVTDTFTVKAADGTEATVTVTITGANDKPTISGGANAIADVTENGTLTATNTLTVADIDTQDVVSAVVESVTANGDAGTLTNSALAGMFDIDVNEILSVGETTDQLTWSFDGDGEEFDHLAAGEELVLTYKIKVTDSFGETALQDVEITITGVNDAPTISTSVDTTPSTNEDTALTGSVTGDDVDNDTLAYTVKTQSTHGSVTIDESTGAYTYTPNADYNGSDSFVITIDDDNGGLKDVTINVTVAGVVDIAADSATTDEDTPITINVLANDNFEDTGATTSVASGPSNGTVVPDGNGQYIYTPNSNYNGTDSFTYTVTSAEGITETATVNITINPEQDAATIGGTQSGVSSEDGTLTADGVLTISDFDVGEDKFQIQNDTAGTYGSFSLDEDGNWNYVLDNSSADVQALKAGQVVNDVFTVKSLDGTEATVTVKVTGANDAPTLTIGSGATASLTENGALTATDTLTVSDIDVEDVVSAEVDGLVATGDTGTISSSDLEAMLDLDVNAILSAGETSDTLTWTFDADGEAFDHLAKGEALTLTYTVKVTDGSGETATQDVIITITGINDEPTISTSVDTTPSTNEDVALTGTITGVDVDSDTLSYSVKTVALKGSVTIDGASGAYTYTPNDDYNGTDSFVITVDDGQGGTKDVTITVTVSAVVDINNDSVSTNEDTPLDIDVLSNDSFDDDDATVAIASGPLNGTLTDNGDGTYKYTPNENYNGSDSFTYEVTSSDGIIETATVNITINSIADAAVIGGEQSGVSSEDGTLTATGNLTITDGDVGEATFQAQTGTAGTYGSLTLTTDGTWTFTLDNNAANVQALKAGQEVTDTFTVKAADGTEATVTVTITGANDKPTISGGANAIADVTENGTLTATNTLTVSDLDTQDVVSAVVVGVTPSGDAGTLTNSTLAGMFDIDVNEILSAGETSDQLTWSFDANGEEFDYLAAGEELVLTYQIKVTDSFGDTALQDVKITVTGVNDEPTISTNVDTTPSTNEDTTLSGTVSGDDTDGDALSYTVKTQSAHGDVSIDLNTGAYTYIPNADYNGTDSFVITVDDDNGGLKDVTINVTIAGVVDIAADSATTDEDTPVTINVLSNDDFEDASATISITSGPSNGTLTPDGNGQYIYTPNPDHNGTDSFTYTVTNADGVEETASVNIAINAIQDAAVISGNQAGVASEDGTLTASGKLDVSDVDAGEANFQVQSDTAGTYGSFTLDTSGDWSYALDNNSAAVQGLKAGEVVTDVFTVKSADGTEKAVVITITGSNDIPTVSNAVIAENINEDAIASGVVSANDVDGDPLNYDVSQQPIHGTVSIDPTTGAYTYTPKADFNGADSFVVTVSDGQGGTVETTVNMTIAAVADGVIDTITLVEDSAVSFNVFDNDSFEDASKTITSFTDAGSGVVTQDADGQFTYTPSPDFNGADSFSYTVTTLDGVTETVTVNFVIEDVPEPVAPSSGEVTFPEGGDAGTSAEFADFEVGAILLKTLNDIQDLGRSSDLLTGDSNFSGGRSSGFSNTPGGAYNFDGTSGYAMALDLGGFESDLLVSEGFLDVDDQLLAETDTSTSANQPQLVLATFIRQNILYVNISDDGEVLNRDKIKKIEVASLDGSELPSWIHMAKEGFVIIERPVGMLEIGLRITATMYNGETIIRGVNVNGLTGELGVASVKDGLKTASFSKTIKEL